MRILHVSHQQLKYLGARNYLIPVRINNGFIRNNHEVFWFSDRDVARCSNIFGTRKMGVGASNRKLLEVCRNFQPDVIALRKNFIQEAERRKFISSSFLDQGWLKEITIVENVLFIAAGVFYYFEGDQVKDFLIRLNMRKLKMYMSSGILC